VCANGKNWFQGILTDPWAADADRAYQQALKSLRDAVAAIGEALDAAELRVALEPGHLVGMGQQFNVLTQIERRGFRDVLFRAYIPTDGWPVSLDLFDDDFVSCQDEDALRKAIGGFIGRQEIRQRLRTLKDYASE